MTSTDEARTTRSQAFGDRAVIQAVLVLWFMEESTQDIPRPKFVPFEKDAYLAHANEDKPFIKALAQSLQACGWRVWLDEAELVIGRSLRAQLDSGLATSRFGVVTLSKNFFDKRWPREELDALFALESDRRTRILPIWLNVTEEDVRNYSPILSSRVAVLSNGDADQAAQSLTKAMEKILTEEGSWGQIVRVQTRYLPWCSDPQFFPTSLRLLDEHFFDFWSWWEKRMPPVIQDAPSPPLSDLFARARLYDGKFVIVVGHQVGPVQFLDDLPVTGDHPAIAGEYVFQMKTGDPRYASHLLYVRLVGPPSRSDFLPRVREGYLTLAAGLPIATGPMILANGQLGSAVYMVATRVSNVPKIRPGP